VSRYSLYNSTLCTMVKDATWNEEQKHRKIILINYIATRVWQGCCRWTRGCWRWTWGCCRWTWGCWSGWGGCRKGWSCVGLTPTHPSSTGETRTTLGNSTKEQQWVLVPLQADNIYKYSRVTLQIRNAGKIFNKQHRQLSKRHYWVTYKRAKPGNSSKRNTG